MLDNVNLKNVLVLDIEAVPQYPSYDDLSDEWKALWNHKMKHQAKDEITPSDLYNRAGIYAEFGKIICISAGYFVSEGGKLKFRIKSFCGDNEKFLLGEFNELLDNSYNKEEHLLCAHNGKEFDFPYIARRCLINGIKIPDILDISGKKPWEVKHLDTMEIWKFGDFKSYTSLNLLAEVFKIESPKADIDGSQVWSVYWIDKDLDRIKTYCQKDVITVAQLLLRFMRKDILADDDIVYAN